MVAGSRLHGSGTVGVASSEGFGNWCTGLSTGITRPTQDELQCGSLRKGLKRRQPLWEDRTGRRPLVTRGREAQKREKTHKLATFPSRMVSHVARFLLMGLSSIPCIDTSYSPSSSCSLLGVTTVPDLKWLVTPRGKSSGGLVEKPTCSYQRPSSVQRKSLWSPPPLCGTSFSSFECGCPKHLHTNTKISHKNTVGYLAASSVTHQPRLLTNVLVGLPVDQTIGVSAHRARHPEQEGVGLDHVTVAGLKLIAGDQ